MKELVIHASQLYRLQAILKGRGKIVSSSALLYSLVGKRRVVLRQRIERRKAKHVRF